jgi:adenosylhomocysteine nucleosidase
MSKVDTAIITAVASEAKPIVAKLGLTRDGHTFAGSPSWSGKVDHHSVILTTTGMGRQRAAEATESLLDRFTPNGVLIAGLAGALDPQLYVRDIVIPDTLIDTVTGNRYAHETGGETKRLITVDRVIAAPAEKMRIHEEHDAALVDMESAVIAGLCESHGVPWLCIRAVLDVADETLPAWLGGCVGPYGKPRPVKTALQALLHPLDLATLTRTALHAPAAAQALADALPPLLSAAASHR